MQGFSLNNISDAKIGATQVNSIYLGANNIWRKYKWVTTPQYHTSNNVPNSAVITRIDATTCRLSMPNKYDYTYIGDGINILYYEFDITGVDFIDITLTTNLIPSSACNLFKTNRTTQITSEVTSIESGLYRFEKTSTLTTLRSGTLTKNDTITDAFTLDPSENYHFSLYYRMVDNGRDYDYFYQANNIGPGIEAIITTI